MSTAQKTKSTWSEIAFTSEAFWTTTFARFCGIAPLIAQRPFITSAYFWPAELALAASSVTSYQGWFSSRFRKRWPTMPVAPRTPTRSFFWLISFTSGVGSFRGTGEGTTGGAEVIPCARGGPEVVDPLRHGVHQGAVCRPVVRSRRVQRAGRPGALGLPAGGGRDQR